MATGYAFHGSCFASYEAAADSNCQSTYPQQGTDAVGTYALSCSGSTPTGLALVRSRTDGTTETLSLTTAYSACSTTAISSAVISPEMAAEAFGWGFGVVLTCYLVAWGCGQVLDAIGWR